MRTSQYSLAPFDGGAYEQNEHLEAPRFLEYWHVLWRHKFKLAAFALIGGAIGLAIGVLGRPLYRARTTLEILSLNQDFLNMRQSSPVTTNDYSYDTSELQTQIKVLQSDSLMNSTIDRLASNAQPVEGAKPEGVGGWSKVFGKSGPITSTARRKALDRVAASLRVKPTGRTRIIELSVDSMDPQLAAVFANTLADQYIARNVQLRSQLTNEVGDWLNRELNSARAQLESSESALQAYARKSGLIFIEPEPHTSVVSERLEQLQQALSAATAERVARQSRYELAQSSPPNAVPEVLNDAGLRDTAAKITELQRHIADLGSVYRPEYSKLRRAQAELSVLQESFARGRSDTLARIKSEYQEASRKEKLLAGAYNAQVREVTGQGEKSIQYNVLKRDVDSNRQLYDTMLQQVKQSSIGAAIRASNVRVVDPAVVPEKPFSPSYPTNAVIGLAAGLLLGLAGVILSERIDRSVRGPGDISGWTRMPELGVIPTASLAEKTFRLRFWAQIASAGRPGDEIARDRANVIRYGNGPSLMAEAFRSLLASILFGSGTGRRPRLVVVTSADVADGKTTVVSNLAIAAAEAKQRVLLIDADLRGPRIHRVFGVPNENGLSDLLEQDGISEGDLQSVIVESGVRGLHILTSGPRTNEAANLLYSPHLSSLMSALKRQYDLVLIDTPPMLQMPDARIIGQLADGVILVARAEQTTRDAIIAASQRFSQDRTRVLGAILNDWDPRKASGAYYVYQKAQYESTYKRYATPFERQPGSQHSARAAGSTHEVS